MTWYFDPRGKRMDVYDHEGELIAEDEPISYTDDDEPRGVWRGEYPNRVKDIAHDHMEGNQPSSYNQQLIADMACDRIEKGVPSE